MSNEKFTKGSWFVSGDARGNSIVCTITSRMGVKTDGFPSDDPYFDSCLISQAPAMYEMLKTIRMVLDGKTEFAPDEIDTIAIDELLAKARGES